MRMNDAMMDDECPYLLFSLSFGLTARHTQKRENLVNKSCTDVPYLITCELELGSL